MGKATVDRAGDAHTVPVQSFHQGHQAVSEITDSLVVVLRDQNLI